MGWSCCDGGTCNGPKLHTCINVRGNLAAIRMKKCSKLERDIRKPNQEKGFRICRCLSRIAVLESAKEGKMRFASVDYGAESWEGDESRVAGELGELGDSDGDSG